MCLDPDHHPDRAEPPGITAELVLRAAETGGSDGLVTLLVGYLRGLVVHGCHCVIINPLDRPEVYVQAVLIPGAIRIESVGRGYLADSGHELSGDQMLTFVTLGWLAPPDPLADPDPAWPRNWWREVSGPRHLERAVLQLVTTLEVHGIADDTPLTVSVFPTDHQDWSWEPDPTHPCGGRLLSGPPTPGL